MESFVLSVITINKNNAAGLKNTIESVLCQSFTDFEYIIIDGASSDGSRDIIEEYESVNKRNVTYKWVSESDSGIYNAMNKGIRMAKGEYLLFLNSGDFFVNDEVLFQVFSMKHSADILCARCNVSKGGEVIWTSELVPDTITLGTLYLKGIMHQSTFIKRKMFFEIDFYDESFRWLADIQFWYKALILHDSTTESLDIVTSDFNYDGLSSTSQKNTQFAFEREWPYRQPVLKHIMPDYANWKKDRAIANKYSWIDRHTILQKVLKVIHRIIK